MGIDLNQAKQARTVLVLGLFLFSFVFIRIYNADHVFMIRFAQDDGGYYAYGEALAKTFTFDWCDKGFSDLPSLQKQCDQGISGYNLYPPGPAIILSPVLLLGNFLTKWGLIPVPSSIPHVLFWWLIGTFFLLLVSGMAILEVTYHFLTEYRAALLITFCYLCGNVFLFYFYRRPMMGHAAQFFCFWVGAWLFVQLNKSSRPLFWVILIAFIAGLAWLSRIDDFYIIGVVGVWLLFYPPRIIDGLKYALVYSGIVFSLMSLILVFKYLQTGSIFYSMSSYNGALSLEQISYLRWLNIKRVFDFFFGLHWGIVWLMPIYWLVFAGIGLAYRPLWQIMKSYKLAVICTIGLLAFHLNMVANLANAASYAYRAIFNHYTLLFCLFLFSLSLINWRRYFNQVTKTFLIFAALIAGFNILNYQSNQTTLTLTRNKLAAEGVTAPEIKEKMALTAPFFVYHSLKHTFTGKAFKNIGASPVVAYPLLALQEFFRSFSITRKALEYYHSPKRRIQVVSDLRILVLYQTITFFISIGFIIVGWNMQKWRRH